MRRIVWAVALAVGAAGLAATRGDDPPKPKEPAKEEITPPTADEKAVLEETNRERKAADLKPLAFNDKLHKAARAQSAVMAKLDKLGHDVDGQTFGDRMKGMGYAYQRVGENVAEGYSTPKAAVAGWMQSPPHKKNLLGEHFTEIGVGLATTADGKKYWTQVFAQPAEK